MSLTVTELAEEVRESNRRLTQAVEGLGQKFDDVRVEVASVRVEVANLRGEVSKELGAINTNLANFRTEVAKEFTGVAKELGDINTKLANSRTEVTRELGAINTNLEAFKGRVETSLAVAKWSVNIMTPLVVSLVAFAVGGAWYLAKLDSRINGLGPVTPHKEVQIEASGSDDSRPSPAPPHLAPKDQKSPPVPK
jgi:hypothetical protein